MGETRIRTARDTMKNNDGIIHLDYLNLTSTLLKEIISKDTKEIDEIKKEIEYIGGGKLRTHNRKGRYVFCLFDEERGREFSITSDLERVHSLARKEILFCKLDQIEKRDIKLSKIVDRCDEERSRITYLKKARRYEEAGLDLCKILFTKEQNEWINEPYAPNPFHQENLYYSTRSGVPMRSKSEVMIGNTLEDIGWPYRSDDYVRIRKDRTERDMSGALSKEPFHESYYADFKVPNLLGGITIHEHFGAFQIDNYADNALKKLNDYNNYTVIELPKRPVQKCEFTWSFEADVRDNKGRISLIRRLLLPDLFGFF